jgi:SNF2 family DNA or RNA helicase
MKTPLLKSQREDVAKIATSIDLPNFSLPGAGKTLTTIGAIEKLNMSGGVVVCPAIATIMWVEELERELGCKAQRVKTGSTVLDKDADFYVLTYGILKQHFSALMSSTRDCLIVDESHYCRSRDSQRTQLVFGPQCTGKGGLYETAAQTWCLTGTPIERYADDLWSQLRATQPDVLARHRALEYKQFALQFCWMEEKSYGKMQRSTWRSVSNQDEVRLHRILYDEIGIIRREVDQELPPLTFREVFVSSHLTGELQSFCKGKTIEQIGEKLLSGGDEMVQARRLTGLAKIKDSVEYIKQQCYQHPVVVGFWHTDVGKTLYDHLNKGKRTVAFIDGSTPLPRREKIRKAFNEGNIDAIVGQIEAMGTAMNLQDHGNHVIIAEDDWSAAKIEQFYKRVYRRGQNSHVQVDFLRSDIPIDIALRKVRERKAKGTKLIL